MTNKINPGELWCSTAKAKNQNSIIFLQVSIANIGNKIIYFIMWFRENKLELVVDGDVDEFRQSAKQL